MRLLLHSNIESTHNNGLHTTFSWQQQQLQQQQPLALFAPC
jgi:hypothetical protein